MRLHAEWTPGVLAYAAGLIEGEGSIYVHGGRRMRVEISCSTDEDVLRNLHKMLGIGHVHGPYDGRTRKGKFANAKPYWAWMVTKKNDAARLAQALYPYMGQRRRGQIATAWMRASEHV